MSSRKPESLSRRLGVCLVSNPDIASPAALMLLNRKLAKQDTTLYDWEKWLRFRDEYFEEILERDNCIRCAYCGKDLKYDVPVKDERLATIDHIHPVAKNGAMWDKNNMVSACLKCNQKKADNFEEKP